jgi:hypothetical protein
VGYRVVEIASETEDRLPKPVPLPPSPVDDRASEVAEEEGEPAPASRPRKDRPPRQTNELALWGGALLGALVGVSLLVGLLLHLWSTLSSPSSPAAPTSPPVASSGWNGEWVPNEAPANVPPPPPPVVRLPAQDAGPEEEGDRPLLPALWDVGKPARRDEPPGARETFGTAVAFARNPLEAAQVARAEHKLTFVLHVSGNFEDARFT